LRAFLLKLSPLQPVLCAKIKDWGEERNKMLRINLLPAYLGEKKKTRLAIVGASLLVAAVTGGSLFAWNHQKQQVETREAEAIAMETEATAVTQLQTDANNIRTAIKPITDKRDFIDAVLFTISYVRASTAGLPAIPRTTSSLTR